MSIKSPESVGIGNVIFGVLVIVGLSTLGYVYRDVLKAARGVPYSFGSTPSGVMLSVDNKPLGRTPITTRLDFGTHVAELKSEGYITLSKGFTIAPKMFQDYSMNVEMVPAKGAPLAQAAEVRHTQAPVTIVQSSDTADMRKEVADLRSMILADPKDAVTVVALQERIRLQGDEMKGLREEISEIRDQGKTFIGGLIALTVGILGFAAYKKSS